MKVTFIDKKTATFGDLCIGDTFTTLDDEVMPCEARLTVERG